jgi:phosphatidylinositol phospholipase C delta
MDGLSIATACFAFIEIADKAFRTISDFVKDCKEARKDLGSVNQELLTLKRTLNLLKNLVTEGGENDVTSNTKRDIREIIRNSLGVTETLEDELRGQEGKLLAINWATKGKKKVATYRVVLETNRRAISLAVETITL